jgi:hypothetical protein
VVAQTEISKDDSDASTTVHAMITGWPAAGTVSVVALGQWIRQRVNLRHFRSVPILARQNEPKDRLFALPAAKGLHPLEPAHRSLNCHGQRCATAVQCATYFAQFDKVALRQARDKLQGNARFKNPAILDTLAWSDYRLGDFEKAKGLLILAKADQSSNPQMRFHYGAVLVALGEQTKGQQIIKDTLDDKYPGRNEAEKMLKD